MAIQLLEDHNSVIIEEIKLSVDSSSKKKEYDTRLQCEKIFPNVSVIIKTLHCALNYNQHSYSENRTLKTTIYGCFKQKCQAKRAELVLYLNLAFMTCITTS